MAGITETKMSHTEDIEHILTLELIETVENRKKKTVKHRNKDYLTMTDFKFSKRFRVCKTSISHLLELIKTNVHCLMGIESHAILQPINAPLFKLGKLTVGFVTSN